jgi:hypothetical protein
VSALPGFGNLPLSRFTLGAMPPSTMGVPWLVPNSLLPNFAALPGPATPGQTTPGQTAPLLAPFSLTPVPLVSAPDVQAPAGTTPPAAVQTVGPASQPPLTSMLPAVLPLVPETQPVTTNDPPPGRVPLDPNKPIVAQLLPPPLVVLLMAAERFPLAGLVITPLLDAKLPPLLAAAMLADTVVPTVPPGAALPDMTAALSNVAALSKPAGVSLPAELGPMGMDVPQAPGVRPASPTIKPAQFTSPSNGDITALSDPVAFRAGYSDYLRNAGTAQITAIAVPGAAAILLFTLGGGFIGYRQARAGHVIRAKGITRFLR